jgi:hypothetical protein
MMRWSRTADGYESGRARIYDGGRGFGPARGGGRWALYVDGIWIANIDYLADAKARAVQEING